MPGCLRCGFPSRAHHREPRDPSAGGSDTAPCDRCDLDRNNDVRVFAPPGAKSEAGADRVASVVEDLGAASHEDAAPAVPSGIRLVNFKRDLGARVGGAMDRTTALGPDHHLVASQYVVDRQDRGLSVIDEADAADPPSGEPTDALGTIEGEEL